MTLFDVSSFDNPPGSTVYLDGFSGTIGSSTFPAEMGWQGDTIDVAFTLATAPPAEAVSYRFRIVVTDQFDQTFDMSILAGPSLEDLQTVHTEYVDTARVLAATIPVDRFVAGQTNYIRIQGVGVQTGFGQPAGILWDRWLLTRTEPSGDLDAVRLGQLQRLNYYVFDAVQSSGLVRDSLPLSDTVAPYHPATPDAGGFALIALCVADRLGLTTEAEVKVEAILSAYAGHTTGVTPERNPCGHFWHWLDVNTGTKAPGWGGGSDEYTTIGSALLVGGALFAKNHFIENANIASLADELYATTDFDIMINPALDGRVAVATDVNCNDNGWLSPWNEYMICVSLALRQPGQTRAGAIDHLWLDPDNLPTRSYREIPTLTDNIFSYAPAFWVHQQYFFNADFSTHPDFVAYLHNHRRADQLYCAVELDQIFWYGLTAGVDPTGYFADRMGSHHSVFSPEAVGGWVDLDTLLEFEEYQPPFDDVRRRYGMHRVSFDDLSWIPNDAGLVDHLFLMFGLAESLEADFFRQRQPFQVDDDTDGIADAYDNCPGVFNRVQSDADADGTGDACACAAPALDTDFDTDVDLRDFARWQQCPSSDTAEACYCYDDSDDRVIDLLDLPGLLDCWLTSGPGVPADPECGP